MAMKLMDNLAWSVRHGVPLQDGLRALPGTIKPIGVKYLSIKIATAVIHFFRLKHLIFLLMLSLCFLASPIFLRATFLAEHTQDLPWVGWGLLLLFLLSLVLPTFGLRWGYMVHQLSTGLDHGMPFGGVMRRLFRPYFPDYVFSSLVLAEREGRLAEFLPVMAEELRLPHQLERNERSELLAGFMKVSVASVVILFSNHLALGLLEDILSDVGSGEALELYGYILWFERWLHPILFGLPIVMFLFQIPRFGPWLRRFIPYFRRTVHRQALCEFSGSMSIMMKHGNMDLCEAAKWSAKVARKGWKQKRILRFYEAVEQGVPWPDALERMKLGTPTETFIAHNAAHRESPHEGFRELREWSVESLARNSERSSQRFEFAVTLFIGLISLLFGLKVFGSLAAIVEPMMDII